jgi:serine/threonine-protein kinase
LAELREAARRIEAGDDSAESAAGADGAAAFERLSHEGEALTVMVVESNLEMQNLLREKLKKHAYRVLVISNPERALDRFDGSPQAAADCVVFCAEELGHAAVEAFNRFKRDAHTQNIPAVLLLDQRQDALRELATFDESHVPLMLPIKVSELRRLVQKLLAQQRK